MWTRYSGFAVVFAEDVPAVSTQDFTTSELSALSHLVVMSQMFGFSRCLEAALPHI
jgi:hypothetical protein